VLIIDPRAVSFGASAWDGVTSVSIARRAARSFEAYGGTGPHVVLADVPEQRVEVTVVQELLSDDMDTPVPGWTGELSFETALNGSQAGRNRVSMQAVVMGVRYSASRKSGSVRTVELLAVSADGAADPVSVEAV
jgi:hypothetical protein